MLLKNGFLIRLYPKFYRFSTPQVLIYTEWQIESITSYSYSHFFKNHLDTLILFSIGKQILCALQTFLLTVFNFLNDNSVVNILYKIA